MTQVPILNGIYTDEAPDFRTSYPRNLIPVPKEQGISKGYLRPASGIVERVSGPGVGRGGIRWNDVLYRVMGTSLVRIASDGSLTTLGDVGPGGQVTFDYSFDRLAIASGGRLYYWNGTTLQRVTDPDLGYVVDMRWVAGYFVTTDGIHIVVTELNDPFAVNPLKYGSSESDPDRILAIDQLRNEIYALNRYTIEAFRNVGGTGFPFERIEGAQVPRGIIGTYAYSLFLGTFAFVGSARGEAPAVYLMVPGDTNKISTREIDQILSEYTENDLSALIMETRVDQGHNHLLIHLPDQCLVYDASASQVLQEPVWFTMTSSVTGFGQYRARNLVWCYDSWLVEDPTSSKTGVLVDNLSSHYGQVNGWEFGTTILYNEGKGAIVNQVELVALTGRVDLAANPVVWTSYSLDGETWGQERSISAGKQGERNKRLAWRRQGKFRNWRIQRFRGTSDAHLSFARLELEIEPLFG